MLVAGGAIPGADDPLLAGPVGVSKAPVPPADPESVVATDGPLPATAEAGSAGSPEPRSGPRVSAILETAVVVIPCGLGAGLAYYFAGSLNQDPIISAILGGVTGLLLGWACMLWIAHAD